MSNFFHTAIASGAAANAATFNGPLGQLDAAIAAIDGVYTPSGTGESESVATAAEVAVGVLHQTTLTLALTGANDIDLADGADHGTGVKLYTFPEGHIVVLGAVINAETVVAGAENGAKTVNMAVGTVPCSDDDALTSTEANIIASTAIDDGPDVWQAASSAPVQVDGTAAATTLYINVGVADAVSSSAVTAAISGTLTVTWLRLGNYA